MSKTDEIKLKIEDIKASSTDRLVGLGLVAFSGCVFVYYTLWVIVLPFVEEGHMIHRFFLPHHYAITLPLIAGVLLLTVIGAFAAITIRKSNMKKKTT